MRWRTQGACSLVCGCRTVLGGGRGEVRARLGPACGTRLERRVLHGSRQWWTQGVYLCLHVALSWRGECVPLWPCTCKDCVLHRSRHEAPTDGASTCGCSTVRGGGDLKVRARLGHACGTRLESACLPWPCTCNVSCNGAAMKLRLMEQACGCSMVRGGVTDSRSRCMMQSGTQGPC